jgi:ectoine hydroxylase-related dioxygenase (phytanoyl-CoA dioxygenase family)
MRVLTPIQRDQFESEGYAVVDGVLDPATDLAPVFAEYDEVLDSIATVLFREGRIQSAYRGLAFADRLIRVCAESEQNFFQEFDISLPQTGIQRDTPIHHGPAVFKLLTSTRLLDLVEDLIGPEIYSNPVQHIRMKLPNRAVAKSGPYSGLVSRVPWHQDNGVVLPEADESKILTVWLPLNQATVENGCMQVIPGSHREGLIAHCPLEKGLTISDGLLPHRAPVPLPMNPGSVLLMTSRTVHSSLDNKTENEVRISFDLRYQPVGQPTGRPVFPGFVARSAACPGAVLKDPAAWASLWVDARSRLAEEANPTFNRWKADVGVCA